MNSITTYKENAYKEKYNMFYNDLLSNTDIALIEWWKYFQRYIRKENDLFYIGCTVCEDLLRQRENTYLDDTYPRD